MFKNHASRISLMVLVGVASLCLMGCPQRTSIGRINREPGRYAGREVAVAGRVVNSFGALGTGVFEIEDGTGRLWIFSDRWGVPGRGAEIGVTGRLENGVSFGGRNFAMALRQTGRPHYRD